MDQIEVGLRNNADECGIHLTEGLSHRFFEHRRFRFFYEHRHPIVQRLFHHASDLARFFRSLARNTSDNETKNHFTLVEERFEKVAFYLDLDRKQIDWFANQIGKGRKAKITMEDLKDEKIRKIFERHVVRKSA